MIKSVFLLMPRLEAQSFRKNLAEWNPTLRFYQFSRAADLPKITDNRWPWSRLISFEFPDIVSESLLSAVGFGAYNFHPGSPAYPGWAPALFAAHDRAVVFGATLHEMIKEVDAGPILATELFKCVPPCSQHDLEKRAYLASIRLFTRFAPDLAISPHVPVSESLTWQGVRRTKKQAAILLMAEERSQSMRG